MLRCRSIDSLQRTVSTPPLVDFSRASHLDLFEQPAIRFFIDLLEEFDRLDEAGQLSGGRSKSFGFFLHVETELFHGGPVVDGKENRVVVVGVFVMMPGPRGHGEDIALVILQALAFDNHRAFTLEGEIEGRAVVPVRQGFLFPG